MVLLSLLCGLFGCQGAPKAAKHSLSEISAVSISCGHTDLRLCYSFWLRREEEAWLLNAEFFTRESKTVLENRRLVGEDAEAVLEILKKNNSIAYVENYRKPKAVFTPTADEDTYVFCLTFSDTRQYTAFGRQRDLEEFFYALAEEISRQ